MITNNNSKTKTKRENENTAKQHKERNNCFRNSQPRNVNFGYYSSTIFGIGPIVFFRVQSFNKTRKLTAVPFSRKLSFSRNDPYKLYIV